MPVCLKFCHAGTGKNMNWDIVLRLEKKIDQLLEYQRDLEKENQRLSAENTVHWQERERVRSEVDRILAKLDSLGQEAF
jgi:hypothetical protein